jgi:hypothetical protein
MSSILVPAERNLIGRLQEGCHLQLAYAADALKAACEWYDKSEVPLEARRQADAIWALVDEIGWSGSAGAVTVDVSVHGATLLAGIDAMVFGLADIIADPAVSDATRAERDSELQTLREFESRLREAMEDPA